MTTQPPTESARKEARANIEMMDGKEALQDEGRLARCAAEYTENEKELRRFREVVRIILCAAGAGVAVGLVLSPEPAKSATSAVTHAAPEQAARTVPGAHLWHYTR